MIPLWVKNRGEQITDSATFRWLAQDAGSGAVDLTLLKGTGSATFTRAGATATTVLSTGLISSTIAANTARSYYDPAPTGGTGSYMFLPGVSGAYASTPSTASLSDTGNKWVTGLVALADYTPSSIQTLCGKFQAVNGWLIQLITTGRLRMYDGTSNIDSTASVPTSDGADLYWGVEHITNNGSNQRETKFYTSSDGVTYTQLGTTVLTATAAALVQNGEFSVGAYTLGTGLPATGRFKRVQIYNGTQTSNTLVADFDPTRTTQASTSFAASTGETWTINGRGFIYAAPAYLGYLAEEARTNLCIRSEELDNAAWTKTATTVTANADAAPDGAATADRVFETATLGGHFVQSTACTISAGNTVTISCFVRQGNLATSEIYLIGGGGRLAGMKFTYATAALSAATVAPVTYTISSSSVKAYPNGWYRISVVIVTSTDTSVTMQFYPLDASSYTGNVANYSTAWGFGVEVGTFATSYTPTAAATSTRAADVMTYPTAGNIDQTIGSAFCRFMVPQQNASVGQPLVANQLSAGNAQLYVPSGSSTQLACFDGTSIILSAAVSDFRNTVTRGASTWSGSGRAIYVNGSSKNTGAFDGTYNGTAIHIGSNASAAQLNGCIRDVRIWQRALSDSEVQAL